DRRTHLDPVRPDLLGPAHRRPEPLGSEPPAPRPSRCSSRREQRTHLSREIVDQPWPTPGVGLPFTAGLKACTTTVFSSSRLSPKKSLMSRSPSWRFVMNPAGFPFLAGRIVSLWI